MQIENKGEGEKMKKMWAFTLILGLISLAQACPTCVSSAHDYSPPFFSDEYYRITEEQDEQVMRNIRVNSQEKDGDEEAEHFSDINTNNNN